MDLRSDGSADARAFRHSDVARQIRANFDSLVRASPLPRVRAAAGLPERRPSHKYTVWWAQPMLLRAFAESFSLLSRMWQLQRFHCRPGWQRGSLVCCLESVQCRRAAHAAARRALSELR